MTAARVALLVLFSPLWVAAALAFLVVTFARYGWDLAGELVDRLG